MIGADRPTSLKEGGTEDLGHNSPLSSPITSGSQQECAHGAAIVNRESEAAAERNGNEGFG